MANIRPMYDRVVVERLEKEEKSTGGIIIPDTAKEKPIQGIILSVGSGKLLDNGDLRALSVKKGDKVLFGKYSGTEVKFGDKEYIVMREDDILAVIE